MRFEVRHELPGDPDWTWTQLFSDDYRRSVAERAQIDRNCLSERVEGDLRVRLVRVTTTRKIPAPIAKVLRTDNLAYEMDETYDDKNRVMTFVIRPSQHTDRVKARGRYELRPGPTPDSCERTVSGQVEVSIPIVGTRIEKFIGAEIEAGYSASIDFLREWLQERRDAQDV